MASISALNISGTNYEIVASSALWAKSGTDFSANSIQVNGDLTANTINGNELVVNGAARVIGTLYADTISGTVSNADTSNTAKYAQSALSGTTVRKFGELAFKDSTTATSSQDAGKLGGAASSNFTNSSLSGYKTIKFGSNTFNGAGSVGSTLEITASNNIAFVNSAANKIGISAKDTTYTTANFITATHLNNITAVSASYTANSANMLSGSSALVKAGNLSATSLNLTDDLTANTITVSEAVVNGDERVLGTLYASNIEGKITSAISADNADKLDGLEASVFASASDVTTLKGYFNNGSAKSADKATSATTSNVAKTLTATISASYSSLSAGSAKLAGTATSAGQAYSARWSKADDNTDLDRVLGLGFSDASAQWTAGNEFYRNTVYDKALTFNSKTDTLKSPNISATNITATTFSGNLSGTATYANGAAIEGQNLVDLTEFRLRGWTIDSTETSAMVWSKTLGRDEALSIYYNNYKPCKFRIRYSIWTNLQRTSDNAYIGTDFGVYFRQKTSNGTASLQYAGKRITGTATPEWKDIDFIIDCTAKTTYDRFMFLLQSQAADGTTGTTKGTVKIKNIRVERIPDKALDADKVGGISPSTFASASQLANYASKDHNHSYTLSANTTAFNVSGGVSISAGSNITITSAGTNIIKIAATDTNTDTKVHQSNTTTNTYRPIILGYTNSTQPSALSATTAEQVYVSTSFYYKPSDGSLYNKGNVNVTGTLTATTVSGTTVSASSALVTSAKVNTGNILTAYGSSAKFDSISATNITGTLKTVAPKANKVQWDTAVAQDKERPFGISCDNDTIIGGSSAYDVVAFSTTLTYNTTKSRMKAPNVSSTTMSSNNYTIENKARMQYNSTDDCIDFLFV